MKETEPQAIIVVGLGFGDEGKGGIVDFLARELPVHTVVRFNGGVQAAHSVTTPDGRYHKFRQFGSGTLVPGVNTHLSRFMAVDPIALLEEGRDLENKGIIDPFSRITVDQDALVTTPLHQATNRLKVLASRSHTSCGLGVSETVADFNGLGDQTLFIKDLTNPKTTLKKLELLRKRQLEKIGVLRNTLPNSETAERELAVLDDFNIPNISTEVYKFIASEVNITDSNYFSVLMHQPGVTLFEGAQGVLLDKNYGFYPYTTWTNTIPVNAETLLKEANFAGIRTTLGLLRAYATRHGDGPFITESAELDQFLVEVNNPFNAFQGKFRVGYFDLILARYAAQVAQPLDGIVLTHLDRLKDLPGLKIASSYLGANGESINELKVRNPTSSKYQNQLTRLLESSKPNYDFSFTTGDLAGYSQIIEDSLGLPISILSLGSTADQKFWTGKGQKLLKLT